MFLSAQKIMLFSHGSDLMYSTWHDIRYTTAAVASSGYNRFHWWLYHHSGCTFAVFKMNLWKHTFLCLCALTFRITVKLTAIKVWNLKPNPHFYAVILHRPLVYSIDVLSVSIPTEYLLADLFSGCYLMFSCCVYKKAKSVQRWQRV